MNIMNLAVIATQYKSILTQELLRANAAEVYVISILTDRNLARCNNKEEHENNSHDDRRMNYYNKYIVIYV